MIEVLAINYKQQADIVERFKKSNNINYWNTPGYGRDGDNREI